MPTLRLNRNALLAAMLTVMAGIDAGPVSANAGYAPPAKTAVAKAAAAAGAYYVRFQPGRAQAAEQALRGQGGRITYHLARLDTFVVDLPEGAATALAAHPVVILIEPVPEHRLMAQVVPWNIDQFQARDVWDKNRDGVVDTNAPDGSGITLCVVDSGIHIDHSDFVGVTLSGTTEGNVGNWFEDGSGHGTHVAGTINAMNNDRGVVGVLPGAAELYIVKVFNNNGTWGGGSLATAIDKCRLGGASVISMSLGGGGSQTEEDAFQDLYDNFGILHVAAAGNDGNNTASAPARYESVVMVGAINEEETAAEFSQTPFTAYDPNNPPANAEWDMVEFAGGGVAVLSTVPDPDGEVPTFSATAGTTSWFGNGISLDTGAAVLEGTASAELVQGNLCDTTNPAWSGKVVLCERGVVSFADKINNVDSSGGAAAVIYNNVAGDLLATCGGNCNDPAFAAITLSQTKGQELLAAVGQVTDVVADDGSPCADCEGGYAYFSGTSMATPGVSAGMAFVWDACGGPAAVTNKDLRLLLRETAKDLSGTQPADPNVSGDTPIVYGAGYDRVTGWGLPQLADALELGNALHGDSCPLALVATPAVREVCTLATSSTDFTLTLNDDFLGSTTLSVAGGPAGASGSFAGNPVVHPNKSSVYTLSGLDSVADGSYALDFTATDDADSNHLGTAKANLHVTASIPAQVTGLSPVDGSTAVATLPTLSWNPAPGATGYLVEVATDPAFASIVHSALILGTSHAVTTMLAANTIHYWRVTPSNGCGSASPTSASFTTVNMICRSPNVAIPDRQGGTFGVVSDTLTVSSVGNLADLDLAVDISHTWVGDLLVGLRHVATNTTVTLIDRPGRTAGGAGCSGNDIDVTLDDEAGAPVETQCAASTPTISGTFTPNNPLSAFDGLSLAGDWQITVTDAATGDTGTLNTWCLIAREAGTNQAPVVTTEIDDQVNAENDAVNLDVSGNFDDADGDTLGFSADGLPTGLSISGAGVISGTIGFDAAAGSPYTVTVTA
ncbi:MAG TPA: S8 family serine peptidase, partial [Xanthomonadaceae bacterium]|nr:S8 family serine peptidase [Xanthomonadaceae bacterium]